MRLSVRKKPKDVSRKFRMKSRGTPLGTTHSRLPGRKAPGAKGSSAPGLKAPGTRGSRAPGLKGPYSVRSVSRVGGRGTMARSLAKSQMKSRARTGMARTETGVDRARTGMYQAQTGASKALAWMIPASIAARRIAADRMMAARSWTAPQFERAAVYFNGSMAPRIGSALSDTAAWIEPARRHRNTRNTVMGTALVLLAGAAMATMAARRRQQMRHLLQPEEGLEAESYGEQAVSGAYSPVGSGYDASYGDIGRGSGTGSNRGIGSLGPE